MSDIETVVEKLQCALETAEEEGHIYAKIRRPVVFDTIELLKKQKPKTGHWILDPDGMDWNIPAWRCSVCGNRHNGLPIVPGVNETNIYHFAGSDFCPNCGVKMNKGNEDEIN